MKRGTRRKTDEGTSHNVWRSYSDMMSGLLLLFVLIMAVCLMQAERNYAEKLSEQAKQLQTQNELNKSQTQLDEQSAQLDEQSDQLAAQELSLTQLKLQLEEQTAQLAEQTAQLAQKEEDLEASQAALDEQTALVASQQETLNAQTSLMASQQEKIDQIIGVKADLIASLNQEFQENQMTVEIDGQTGAMVLNSSVLFDYNESVLKDEGSQILSQVLPVYCSVLLSQEYEPYVAEVIIDGYTDTTGDYITNLDLSQRRAFAVAEYLLNTMGSFMDAEGQSVLSEKLTVNGRSESNPILDENGEVDMDASRRVEIKFRLKDEEMISSLREMIEESGAVQEGDGEAA